MQLNLSCSVYFLCVALYWNTIRLSLRCGNNSHVWRKKIISTFIPKTNVLKWINEYKLSWNFLETIWSTFGSSRGKTYGQPRAKYYRALHILSRNILIMQGTPFLTILCWTPFVLHLHLLCFICSCCSTVVFILGQKQSLKRILLLPSKQGKSAFQLKQVE